MSVQRGLGGPEARSWQTEQQCKGLEETEDRTPRGTAPSSLLLGYGEWRGLGGGRDGLCAARASGIMSSPDIRGAGPWTQHFICVISQNPRGNPLKHAVALPFYGWFTEVTS